MTTVAGLPPGVLESALPHAVNLAEAGSSIEERKTGTFRVASDHFIRYSSSQGIYSVPRSCLRIMILNSCL